MDLPARGLKYYLYPIPVGEVGEILGYESQKKPARKPAGDKKEI
jgi:hypothetical protein